MRCKFFIGIVVGIFLISSVFAMSDIAVFQGQYYNKTSFIKGTFEFTFDIYDAGVGGNLIGSYKTNLTTGNWGQWRVEIPGVSAASNDTTKDYFMEILIDEVPQLPRKRLTHFNYLRKDVDESTTGGLILSGLLEGMESLRILEAIIFIDHQGNVLSSIYKAQLGKNFSNVPSDFEGSLIFEIDSVGTSESIGLCFWDNQKGSMKLCLNEGLSGRATTFRRSVQIVGNTTVKENDKDFTLCEGVNYIDCSTDITGADLFVQDDIEAQSIYANENVVAQNFIGDGSQLVNLDVSLNDTLQTITDRGAVTSNNITIGSVINFILGGYIQEFVDKFFISKDLEVSGDVNVSGSIYSGEKLVCLEDGTNCQTSSGNGSGSVQYVNFISTVDGKLSKNDRYLALGTDGGISGSVTEMAWIIDRDITITGILWDSKSNSRTKTSAITLMSGDSKNSLSDTSLSKDIQGVVSGSDLTFSVSLSQGDVAAIKYDSGGNGGNIDDLSITLIGTYD